MRELNQAEISMVGGAHIVVPSLNAFYGAAALVAIGFGVVTTVGIGGGVVLPTMVAVVTGGTVLGIGLLVHS